MFAKRNKWGAITQYPRFVIDLIDESEKAQVFTRGIETDSRGRGEAVNVDVFGYSESLELAVIQVRQCKITKWGNNIRKDYFLIGHNENGSLFSHPVDSPARSKSVMNGAEWSAVNYVLCKIWNCTPGELAQLKRQGDLALLPARLPRGAERIGSKVEIRETHRIDADDICSDGDNVYCTNPHVYHTRGQHGELHETGTFRVIIGQRAETWRFTKPTAD